MFRHVIVEQAVVPSSPQGGVASAQEHRRASFGGSFTYREQAKQPRRKVAPEERNRGSQTGKGRRCRHIRSLFFRQIAEREAARRARTLVRLVQGCNL